jgi:hypothetical protein
MSYPDPSEDLIGLVSRKEFQQLVPGPHQAPPDELEDLLARKYLRLQSHQLFVRNFMNPNTKHRTLHLDYSTGVGKTLSAVAAAHEFVKVYRRLYESAKTKITNYKVRNLELDRITPTVYVLGFEGAKSAFIKELLNYTEFGFVTHTEKEELMKKIKIAESGIPADQKAVVDYLVSLKKRITNKSKGGFYKFYGYGKFSSKLFGGKVKPSDLEAELAGRVRADRAEGRPLTTMRALIDEYKARGQITINEAFLKTFEQAFIIGDEIHNTYNMNWKNDRGVALQYVIDNVPSARLLTLSATPINSNPSEILDLLEYMTSQPLVKSEYFSGIHMKPGAAEKIAALAAGHFAFIQDTNPRYYPAKETIGSDLVLPADICGFAAGSTLPYFKFVFCPMSQYHQEAVTRYMEEGHAKSADSPESLAAEPAEEQAEVGLLPEENILPTDGYTAYDMVFPGPAGGIFRSSDMPLLVSADSKWKEQVGIRERKSTRSTYYSGSFLREENIGQYSSKYHRLLQMLRERLDGSGKMMIYHDRVVMSGVLLLQELLKANGFCDEYTEPVADTLCARCGRTLGGHDAAAGDLAGSAGAAGDSPGPHKFAAARFIVAHAEVEKSKMRASIDKFNAPDNTRGDKYLILLGSRIISESYDFKAIRNLFVLSLPVSIPIYLQVVGRAARSGSHLLLPVDQRTVTIHVLVSTVDPRWAKASSGSGEKAVSPELYRYIAKIATYMEIQKVERICNGVSVNKPIHYGLLAPQLGQTLGNLPLDPPPELGPATQMTFDAYKYNTEEINTIIYIIKRLFMQRPVWTVEGLYERVRAPPVALEINPALFARENFTIALGRLVEISAPLLGSTLDAIKLLDSNDAYIYTRGGKHSIVSVGEHLLLCPVVSDTVSNLNPVQVDYIEYIRDKERSLMKMLAAPRERVYVDVESYMRYTTKESPTVDVAEYMSRNVDTKYQLARENFAENVDSLEISPAGEELPDIYDFLFKTAEFQRAFIEEAIVASSAGKLDDIQAAILELMERFGCIIRERELSKYKDVAKRLGFAEEAAAESQRVVGYTSGKTVRVLAGSEWTNISRLSINQHITYRENDVIVGQLESGFDSSKFKLRRPLQKISEEMKKNIAIRTELKSRSGHTHSRIITSDLRLADRGIVCETKNKKELMIILTQLGAARARFVGPEVRTKKLCAGIFQELVRREFAEREKDSRVKYLYGWWNEEVNINTRI